ncbi:GspH/FimT family pseudopilin [Arenimonas sp.]|uniref:GspH/FimT family pseudopilin n=1 Tax=Arenimonas sp. TaxID=1872635 RepID=UPI0035B178C2
MGRNASKIQSPTRPAAGFTLVELMVVVAVLAVGLVLAVPSFTTLTRRNALISASNEIVGALQTAKAEAIRRNRRVSLCASSDGVACNSADWSRMIVIVDGSGEVVSDLRPIGPGITGQGSSNVAGTSRIRFGADGLVRIGAAANREGAISLCSDDLPVAENTRDIRVSVSRIWTETRDGTAACAQLTD